MGAWTYIEPRLRKLLGSEISYAGRNASASPAVGALAVHKTRTGLRDCGRFQRLVSAAHSGKEKAASL